MRSERPQFSQVKRPGSSVPGPPRKLILKPLGSGGGEALIDATSNCGDVSGVCASAPPRAAITMIAIFRTAIDVIQFSVSLLDVVDHENIDPFAPEPL